MTEENYEFETAYQKGFLNKDMELFYICTDSEMEFKYHYHDFYKLLIHIRGASLTTSKEWIMHCPHMIRF